MFVELIEALRCPRLHEESPLVASASRTQSRHIADGVLGCPVCGAEFTIANGVAQFDDPEQPTPAEQPSAATALRLAAFLELTDALGFAILCGRWGAHADQVLRVSDTPLVLVNPPRGVTPDAAGVIRARDVVPFAAGVARAAALDAGPPSFVESVVRAVRAGGRVVGPVTLPVPEGVTELARDDLVWVAEKTGAPERTPLVPLTRASR